MCNYPVREKKNNPKLVAKYRTKEKISTFKKSAPTKSDGMNF